MSPEQVSAELRRSIPVLEEEALKAMHGAVDLTHLRMSELAPGSIGRTVAHVVRHTSIGVSGTVRPTSKHAAFVDQGTGHGKVVRNTAGQAYSFLTGHAVSGAYELSSPFDVRTATGWGAKTPGGKLALHLKGGGTIFRSRVSGQRAQHFVEKTRLETAAQAETLLAKGAQAAADRLFP